MIQVKLQNPDLVRQNRTFRTTIYVIGKINGDDKKVKKLVEQHGYEWTLLTERPDLLVYGKNPDPLDLNQAKNNGIPMKSWQDFINSIL